MSIRHSVLIGCVMILASALMSCRSSPTRIYTLYDVAPAAAARAYSGPALRVDSVHIPPALDRIEIVYDTAPGEVKINDLDHWSAPPAQAARQTLSADLVERLPPGLVIFPHLSKPADALGLSVDILGFEADQRGARLLASWTLTPAAGAEKARQGTATFKIDRSIASARGTVQALSLLLGQLADRIVAELGS